MISLSTVAQLLLFQRKKSTVDCPFRGFGLIRGTGWERSFPSVCTVERKSAFIVPVDTVDEMIGRTEILDESCKFSSVAKIIADPESGVFTVDPDDGAPAANDPATHDDQGEGVHFPGPERSAVVRVKRNRVAACRVVMGLDPGYAFAWKPLITFIHKSYQMIVWASMNADPARWVGSSNQREKRCQG